MKVNSLVLALCVGSLFLASCSAGKTFLETPQDLKATPGINKIDLSWVDKSDNEAGFAVYRSLASESNFIRLDQTASANAQNYTDANVDTANNYVYQVRAFAVDGSESAPSVSSEAVSATKLAAPSDLSATAGENKIDLTWTDNSSIEDGFKIFRKLGSEENFQATITVDANATSYSDTDVTAGNRYVYQIVAVAGENVSDASNTTDPVTPTAPANPNPNPNPNPTPNPNPNPNPNPTPIVEPLKGEWKGHLENVGDVELSADEDLDPSENGQRNNARFTYLNSDATRFIFECRVTGSNIRCTEFDLGTGEDLGDSGFVISATFTAKGKIEGTFKNPFQPKSQKLTLSRVNP